MRATRNVAVWCALALATHGHAQVIRWSELGQRNVYRVGWGAAAIADRDGDGFQDVASVVQICQPGGSCDYFALWIFSGSDGRVLLRYPDFGYANRILAVTATGDDNGDGVRDYAIAVSHLSQVVNVVEVRSGADDSVLWSVTAPVPSAYTFGNQLVGDVDLDGDGQPDLLVADPTECRGCALQGAVYAYTSPGRQLYHIRPTGNVWSIGQSIAKVGDVDGDGGDDFVTTGGEPGQGGVAYLISGRDGREIRRVFGRRRDRLGVSCAGCDDLDADGVPDFAVGAGGFASPGLARVYSSATGRQIYSFTNGLTSFAQGFGSAIKADIDIDRDGIDDILIADPEADTGHPRGGGGYVYAFSGRDGGPLFHFSFIHLGQSGAGYSLETMPPQPGSPFPYILAGTVPNTDNDSLHLVSAALPGVDAVASACAGALPRAPQLGIRMLDDQTTRLHLANAGPGAVVAITLGLSRANVPLDVLRMPGCALSNSAEVIVTLRAGASGLDAGYAHADLPLPLRTTSGGVTIYGQWIVLGAGPRLSGGTSDTFSWRH